MARLQSELRWEKERRQSCDQDRIFSKLEVWRFSLILCESPGNLIDSLFVRIGNSS